MACSLYYFPVGDGSVNGCESASCRMVNEVAEDMGQLSRGLQTSADGNLVLKYLSSIKPDSCLDRPTTTITFVCPQRGGVSLLLLCDHC